MTGATRATDVPAPSLRAAQTSDLETITAIERASFSDPWSRSGFAALLRNPTVLFLVAADAAPAGPLGDVVGSVVGYVVAWFAADESEIANIAVAPDARGRGVGARLLDAALAEAVRRGAATTYLEVRESNGPARQLYASRGFEVRGRRRRYYHNPSEDALVLGRPTPPMDDRRAPNPAAQPSA